MTRKKITNRDKATIFCNQNLSSFISSCTQMYLRMQKFHLLPKKDFMTLVRASQKADSVDYTSGFCAFIPLMRTPPQVDKSECKNRRAEVVGKSRRTVWEWPVYGGDKEKDGKRKTEKTRPDKSKRENDKGLKKKTPPKRDGLVSFLRKSR